MVLNLKKIAEMFFHLDCLLFIPRTIFRSKYIPCRVPRERNTAENFERNKDECHVLGVRPRVMNYY